MAKDLELIKLAADGLELGNDGFFLGNFPKVHESGRTIFIHDAAVVEQNANGIAGAVSDTSADYTSVDQAATDAANGIG